MMVEKQQLNTRKAIELLVNEFYKLVQGDDLIGDYFNDVAKVNWDVHLLKMYDFWESLLLDAGKFKGNMTDTHFKINGMKKIEQQHLQRWLMLFKETLDRFFEGEKAEEAYKRAENVGLILLWKLDQYNQNNNN